MRLKKSGRYGATIALYPCCWSAVAQGRGDNKFALFGTHILAEPGTSGSGFYGPPEKLGAGPAGYRGLDRVRYFLRRADFFLDLVAARLSLAFTKVFNRAVTLALAFPLALGLAFAAGLALAASFALAGHFRLAFGLAAALGFAAVTAAVATAPFLEASPRS